MISKRMLVLAAVALLLSGAVTYYVYRTLQRTLQPAQDTTQIVVASQKIVLGKRLDASDLRLAAWPRATIPEGSFDRVENALGRGALIPMMPNEPVLESKLAPREAGAGLTTTIPDGMRAISLKVNDVISVAGFVGAGSRIDLILTGTPPAGGSDSASRIVLENVQVLAAGQNVEQDVNGKPQNVSVITLLVTPEDAQKVSLASSSGQIQLALRNPLDLEHKNPAAVSKPLLWSSKSPAEAMPQEPVAAVKQAKPKPKKAEPVVTQAVLPPPPPPEPKKISVSLIQGQKVETVNFTEKKP